MATPKLQLLSRTQYDTDGLTIVWDFNFSGGYILPEHVKAYYDTTLGVRTNITVTPSMLIGPNQLQITPAIPAGNVLTIYRSTPKDQPLVDFVDRGTVSEVALDTIAKQSVFVAAEASDEVATFNGDIAATAAGVAVTSAAAAALSATSAATSAATASGAALSAVSSAIAAYKETLSWVSVFDYMTPTEVTNVQDRLGTLDVTYAFHAAIEAVHLQGGGTIYAPPGLYRISNMRVMRPNVRIVGAVSQHSYELSFTRSTVLSVAPGSDWGVLFGAGATGANWGNYSGMSNVVIDGGFANEFGLCVCVINTVITDVTVTGFQYGCVAASYIIANIWERCNFFKNTKINFAVVDRFGVGTALEAANPGVVSFVNGFNTTFTVRNCNMREGGYGIVIINALGAEFTNCVVESNTRAGLWVYRQQPGGGTDNKYNRQVTFNKVWLENNWQGYIPGNAYPNTGWRYVDYTPDSIYNPVTDAGYGIVAAGYSTDVFPEGYEFNYCSLTSLAGVIWAKRSKFFKFYQCILIGSTVPVTNVTLSADAVNYTFERCEFDPYAPNTVAQKAHILTQGTGTWIIENERTNTAAGVLSDYKQGAWVPSDVSGGGIALNVLNARYTRVGNLVTVSAWITYPVNSNGSQAIIGNLPFAQSSPYGGMGFTAFSTAGPLFARTNDGSSLLFVDVNNANVTNAMLSGKTFALKYEYFVD